MTAVIRRLFQSMIFRRWTCGEGALARQSVSSTHPAYSLLSRAEFPVLAHVFEFPPRPLPEPWPETAHYPTASGHLQSLFRSAPVLSSAAPAPRRRRFFARKSHARRNVPYDALRTTSPVSSQQTRSSRQWPVAPPSLDSVESGCECPALGQRAGLARVVFVRPSILPADYAR